MILEFGAAIGAAIVIGIVVYIIKNRKKKEENFVTHTPTNRVPAKRAVLVGINKYKPELNADLKGCVNDVEAMRDLLIKFFGFSAEDIRVLCDDRATKAAILERLSWLIGEAVPGDVLVFHYSGHGSQVRDRDGDELADNLDEILCPYDLDWDDPLTDDIIGAVFDKVPAGASLIMICDACHSGTMTKELLGGASNPSEIRAKFIMPPFDIKARTLGRDIPKTHMRTVTRGSQRHVLLSGCKDDQTSADATFEGVPQGALTWATVESIKVNPNVTWTELYSKILNRISGRFIQTPQLSGDTDLLGGKIFKGA